MDIFSWSLEATMDIASVSLPCIVQTLCCCYTRCYESEEENRIRITNNDRYERKIARAELAAEWLLKLYERGRILGITCGNDAGSGIVTVR